MRPWVGVLQGPPEVTGANMVGAMDAVGVDGALLVSPYAMYRFDASYAVECQKAYPGRFGLIKPVDPANPAVADVIAEWKRTPGTVGARIMLNAVAATDAADPGLNRTLAAAAEHGLPVNMLIWGRLEQARGLAERNPDTQIVIDHLALQQPFAPPAPKDGWAEVPRVLKLAELKNVAMKISGACTLAQQPFPYDDIWDQLARYFDAFGLDRCLWGTDWTRATGVLTYGQGVEPFRNTRRLSDGDRAKLMGGSLARIYKWAPTKAA